LNFAVLTQISGILKPFAWLFGVIFNWIYELLCLIGIENIAVTLIFFTIIVKMIMLPLTVRQQRFSKLSAKMQPELSAIQEKYKGRKDEQSQRLQQMETQEVYSKYGTNPTAGCLPMLISLPIMFAMYRIIYAIPAYVGRIKDYYSVIAEAVMNKADYSTVMAELATTVGVPTAKFTEAGGFSLNHVIDIMTKFNTSTWETLLSKFNFSSAELTGIHESIDKINHTFSMGTLNILDSPKAYGLLSIAIIVPILAVVTQLGSSLLQKAQNKTTTKQNQDNPMGQSMNSMLYIMPFISGFFCYSLPLCIGIYWVISTVVSVVQQIFINIYIERSDMDAYIAKNVEKQNKRREKLGVAQGNTMSQFSKAQTRSINYDQVKQNTTASYANISGSSTKNVNKKVNTKDPVTTEDNDASQDQTTGSDNSSFAKGSLSGYANILKKN
jgi:YidC/Oxa1 family membrane protein insertase